MGFLDLVTNAFNRANDLLVSPVTAALAPGTAAATIADTVAGTLAGVPISPNSTPIGCR